MKKLLVFLLSFGVVGSGFAKVTISNPPTNPKLSLKLRYKNGQRQQVRYKRVKKRANVRYWINVSGNTNITKIKSINTDTSLIVKYKSNKSFKQRNEFPSRIINSKLQSIDVQKNGTTIQTITVSGDGAKHEIKALLKDKQITLHNPGEARTANAHYADGSREPDVNIGENGSAKFDRLKGNKNNGQKIVKIVVKPLFTKVFGSKMTTAPRITFKIGKKTDYSIKRHIHAD